jgi:hypothetical protein
MPSKAPTLTRTVMHDGSLCFLSLPAAADWYAVRDHVADLGGAELTGFLTDHVTECWIDFRYCGHEFSINDAPGDYWFFVKDPACPDVLLRSVAAHFSILLERPNE